MHFGISPKTFAEYELQIAQRDFDPREVGFEAATRNLEAWVKTKRLQPSRERAEG